MNAPTLRIVIGTAGSGKSTIAQRLARQHGAAYLDKDAMRARFVEAALVSAGYDPGDREANPFWMYVDCAESNQHVVVGKDSYLISLDGFLMPTKKGQAPPDTRYFEKK